MITGMWRRDPELADTVARLAWIADGITGNESQAITVLADIAARDTVVALQLPSVLWISDGVTEDEIDAILEFRRIVNAGTELAGRVLDYPWFARDISYDDQRVLYGLAQIAASDTELANRISEMSRVADAEVTTSHLWEPLDDLNIIAKRDRALARQVGDLLSGEFGVRDRHLLSALRTLIQESPEAFEQLSNRPWFADGLDDEEAAFLVTTRDILENSPGDFYEMIQSRYTQSKTIDLPLTGNVNIWAIQETPFPQGENIVADIEDALRSLEELTLTPLPTTDLIVLIVVVGPDSNYEQPYSNLATPWPGEAHAVSHVRMSRYQSGPYRRHTLFHEVAHYYFEFFPAWFLEGGAEFAADYIWNRNVAGSFTEWESSVDINVGPGCSNGAANLHQLGTPGMAYLAVGHKSCFYTMGKHFLSSLFLSLGEDVTSAALRDVFSQIRSVESRPVTAKDIYLAFQRNIRPGQEDEFGDLFRRLYGGPLADANANVRDDHGNELSTATPIAMDVVVHGALEHPLDTDYFRFTAEADRDYVLTFSHDIFNDYAGGDLYVSVHPPDGGHPEPLESAGGGESGMRVQWEAPRSGEYRVSLESTVGTTGAYTLQITPVVVHADDHGDDPTHATDVIVGEKVTGNIDYETDADYFRFQAEAGQAYQIEVADQTLDYPRVTLYQSDGTTRAGGYSGGQWGSDIRWRVSDSGVYYLVVVSPQGNIGAYSLTVNAIASGGDDHGDDALTATAVSLGKVLDGTLDNSLDRDYFRFEAEANQTYNMRLNHFTTTFQPVTLLASDGVTPVHEYWPSDRQTTGSFIPWVAPESGYYFLVFHSPDGDTGDYTLVILPGAIGDDDHGDIPVVATALPAGQGVEGALDHRDDFDYFRFQAEAGQRYEIAADYDSESYTHGTPDPRVSLYHPDGVNPETRYVASGRRESGKYIQWVAPVSGQYYVVMWSPKGDIGPYTVTVTGEDS